MSRRRHYGRMAALSLAALPGGCAKPPLLASWYMVPEMKDADVSDPDLIVALNNRGRETIIIHDIALTPPPKRRRPMENLPGFRAGGSREPLPLPAGGLLVVELAKRGAVPACTIPTALYVRTKASKRPHRVALGGLPTFLTEEMLKCKAEHYLRSDPAVPASPLGAEKTIPTSPP